MDKTPFSVYDFFAYLASGAVIVVSLNSLFGEQILLRPSALLKRYAELPMRSVGLE